MPLKKKSEPDPAIDAFLDFGDDAGPDLDAFLPPDVADEPEDAGPDVAADGQEVVETLKKDFLSRAKNEENRFYDAVDTEFWVAFCFESREQKEEFLRKLKLTDLGDKHINGLEVAERLGVKITSPRPTWKAKSPSSKLSRLT